MPSPSQFTSALESLAGKPLPGIAERALERLLSLDRLSSVHDAARGGDSNRSFCERLIDNLGVHVEISVADLDRIPRQGPIVAVANHPFGLMEGVVLGVVLPQVRSDFKTMANALLEAVPEIQDHFIAVNPFGGPEAKRANLRGLKESIAWLKNGGMLTVFPAGEVAHVDLRRRAIIDPEWSDTATRLARLTGAAVLPMYFHGANGALFQLLGLLHPRLRTAMLAREFLNKRDATMELRIGNPISAERLQTLGDDRAVTAYLRQRAYLLGSRDDPAPRKILSTPGPPEVAHPAQVLEREIARLDASQVMAEQGEFAVLLARSGEIPSVLSEIGRLLRQYLKLGGKLVSFNVDSNFADAVDGLIVVDLTKTSSRMLERYMGADAARSFLEFHSQRGAA